MADVVHRFKSAISNMITLTLFNGKGGNQFFTLNKSTYNKETKKYDDTPFLNAADLAAAMSACRQALAYLDANPTKRVRTEAPEVHNEQPRSSKPVSDDDIPF